MFRMVTKILLLALLALTFPLTLLSGATSLQDFCVADPSSQVSATGLACKDPKLVQPNDFFFTGLHNAGNTSNPLGSTVTPVSVAQVPALNTLGISQVRLDYAPSGVIPPHTHRATEILTVLEGNLLVGFVTSTPENRLISKVLKKGDVFVFPVNLIHFQYNVGQTNAVAIAALNSENPGVIFVANSLFGSEPAIPTDFLAKTFQVDRKTIEYLQSKF